MTMNFSLTPALFVQYNKINKFIDKSDWIYRLRQAA